MTEATLLFAAIGKAEHTDNKWHKSRTWWSFAAFGCFVVSLLSAIIGLFMSGIGHFAGADAIDSEIGTLLVALSFPLMMFGAHALDKIAEVEKKRAQGN